MKARLQHRPSGGGYRGRSLWPTGDRFASGEIIYKNQKGGGAALKREFEPVAAPRSAWIWFILVLTGLTLVWAGWLMIRTVWGVNDLHYTLTETTLEISYGPTQVEIPRNEILSVEQVAVSGGKRLFGTALPGLQEGAWTFPETGRVELYSTEPELLTVVQTPTKKYGISPADSAGFISAVEGGGTGRWDPAPTQAGRVAVVMSVIVLAIIIGTIVLLAAIAVGAKNILYVLDSDGILIQMGWMKARIPYKEIEALEKASPQGSPIRTVGAAMPGLYWGTFYFRKEKLRLKIYATQYRPLVLIHAGKSTYGLNPADADGFIAEVSRRARLG